MREPFYRIEVYKYLTNGHSRTPIVYNSFLNGTSGTTLKIAKDRLSLSFANNVKFNTWESKYVSKQPELNKFNFNDNIKIYAWYDTTPTNYDDYLIIDVIVKSFSFESNNDGSTISITTSNRTEEILRYYRPYVSIKNQSSINTPPLIIRNLIDILNKDNNPDNDKKLMVLGLLDSEVSNITGLPGNIASTKLNGSSFTPIDYSSSPINIYNHIAKLSDTKYTNDTNAGTYLFYIKNTPVLPYYQPIYGKYINELVWKPRGTTLQNALVENEDLFNIKVSYNVGDVINHLIIYAGEDCEGAGINTYVLNSESSGRYGLKSKYYSESQYLANELINNELKIGDYANSYHTPNDIDPTYQRYPAGLIAGSLWTFSFNERNTQTGAITGISKKVYGKKDYNNAIREEAKWRAREEGNELLRNTGNPKYKVECSLELGNTHLKESKLVPGDIYNLKIPSIGWKDTTYNLRLTDINHQFSPMSWTTSLVFKEDDKTVSSKVNL